MMIATVGEAIDKSVPRSHASLSKGAKDGALVGNGFYAISEGNKRFKSPSRVVSWIVSDAVDGGIGGWR